MHDEGYVPMKRKEIAIVLSIPKDKREALAEVLDELVEEGKVTITKKGYYKLNEEQTVEGRFISHANGFGFIEVEGQDEDYFVSKDNIGNAMQDDTVKAIILEKKSGKRKEAKVIEIVSHGNAEVVGTYEACKNYGFVICDNQRITSDIFIPAGKSMGAVDGHKVVVHLTDYGSDRRNPEGEVTEIIGHKNDPGVDILSIVKSFGLPTDFEDKVLKQAVNVAKPVSKADMAGRKDLRKTLMVTIDGADSKDLDDAVSVSFDGEHYTLGVHIADVSNYVQERSALDNEALKRGTSCYLVDRVIPMLPHTLSNGICSLNEGEDRLALSCIMTIDKNGKIVDHEICESVVKIDRRMTYTDVTAIIESTSKQLRFKYRKYVPMFELMAQLSDLLRANRKKRGAIDFDFPESKIEVNEAGEVVGIHPYERNVASRIIEDFMLAANETVAEHFYFMQSPFLYRIHTTPDLEKLRKLNTFLGSMGYRIKGDLAEIHPKEIQKLIESLEGEPEEDFISRLILRSMQQAKYDITCQGHFGLSARYYCHFTSPIRRYPDLQIHRIIKDHLRGRFDEKKISHYNSLLPVVATSTSKNERRAEECEREVDKLKKVQYMKHFIGDTFTGIISSVTGWGFYVELPNTIDGLVHVSTLRDDHYIFSEDTYELVGVHKGRRFKMGEEVTVVLTAVDDVVRTIDFELA